MTHLTSLNLEHTWIDDTNADAFGECTWMEVFRPYALNLRSPSFLANMTQLRSVSLECGSEVDIPLFVSAVSHCTRIDVLRLSHAGLTSAHLCSLLSALPLIWHLTLVSMDSLATLEFASSVAHLARTLESLAIVDCAALPPVELRHLDALVTLQELQLHRCFAEPLEPDVIARMAPTLERGVWPNLEYFEYSPPTASDPD